jgi:ribA/ribD-fused uncharacterized protein
MAFTVGQQGKNYKLRDDWTDVNFKIMKDALVAKFIQNLKLKNELIMTGSKQLVFHIKSDNFWGDGGDKGTGTAGKNALGKLIMEIRDQLRNEAQQL